MAAVDVPRDLKYVYGWNFYTMRFMGIWPQEKKWKELSNYVVLMPVSAILCFVCAPQTTNLLFIWGDFDLIIENLSMGNMTFTISLLKTIAFWSNGKPLKSLLACMANDWRTVTKKEDRERMLKIARITREISMRSTVMSNSVVVTYVMLRYFSMQDNEHHLLFRAHFPYDDNVSPNYELTFLGQLVAAVYAATSYTAVDTFVGMLVLHVCGQLSNLSKELKNLQAKTKLEFRVKLRNIVRRHEYLNRFAQTIEACFNVMLLAQMLSCTIQLCFQCFQAIMSINGEANRLLIFQFLFLMLYVVYVLLQLYLYCYVGERLSVESAKIANAAYDCDWYNLSVAEAKLLIIIMCRARLPLYITAGKFCNFTVELYNQVLKTSMGYISVLYAMRQ